MLRLDFGNRERVVDLGQQCRPTRIFCEKNERYDTEDNTNILVLAEVVASPNWIPEFVGDPRRPHESGQLRRYVRILPPSMDQASPPATLTAPGLGAAGRNPPRKSIDNQGNRPHFRLSNRRSKSFI